MDTQKTCQHCGKPLEARTVHGLCPQCLLKAGIGSAGGGGRTGFIPPKPEELTPLFPQLEILELLGKGGMGAVYKARQKGLNRMVALKILPPDSERDPAFAERFTREAQSLAQLNHPGIVAVHEFGCVPIPESTAAPEAESAERAPDARGATRPAGLYYFIMEYVDGANLRQMLRAQRLSPREAMAIVPQICDALQYAHDQGIVHRDIKPENVLVDRRGRVKIADFGLAKLLGKDSVENLTRPAEVMGTPQYMAPEQLEKPLEVDHRADIYSLGVVFYEMLTGELPLGRFPAPSRKVEVDVRLDEIVLRALEKEPQLRYQHASALKTEVETVANVPGTSSAKTPTVASAGAGRLGPIAFGLFIVATLGTLALMTVSANHDLALVFGAVALVLAFALGIMSWRDKLGRFVVVSTSILFVLGIAGLAVMLAYNSSRIKSETARNKRLMEQAIADLTERARSAQSNREPAIVLRDQSATELPMVSNIVAEFTFNALTNVEEGFFALTNPIHLEIDTNNFVISDSLTVSEFDPTAPAVTVSGAPLTVAGVATHSQAPSRAQYAWRETSTYIPPDFNAFFPDDREGGRRLDRLWSNPGKDTIEDDEIFRTVRQGLRRTREYRTSILRWIGNRYIWDRTPQNADAIEIMYHAADFRPDAEQYGTRHYAVYFGLSVVDPKTPPILRTLADLCVAVDDPNDLDRVAWGVRDQREEFLRYLAPHLQSREPATRSKARLVRQIIEGTTNAFEWAAEIARQRAEERYTDELPRLRQVLSSGDSRSRKEALALIAKEGVALIMNDSFVSAYARCARDEDREVRNRVAQQVGQRWIWNAKTQNVNAIDLMLQLSRDPDREVRESAVYYGLSVIRNKEEPVIRRLIELAMEDEEENPNGNFGRITWGLRGERQGAARVLDEYLSGADAGKARRALEIYERIVGRAAARPDDRAAKEALARDLEARKAAAMRIMSFSQRDAALAGIARDAARANLADVAKTAVANMAAFSARDAAAQQAARELVKAGNRAAAIEIANTITSFSTRDATLRELAQ